MNLAGMRLDVLDTDVLHCDAQRLTDRLPDQYRRLHPNYPRAVCMRGLALSAMSFTDAVCD